MYNLREKISNVCDPRKIKRKIQPNKQGEEIPKSSMGEIAIGQKSFGLY